MKRLKKCQWAVVAFLIAVGCSPQGITIGPYPVTMPVEGGSIDPLSFILVPGGIEFDYTTKEDFCALPTEQELADRMPTIAGIEVSGFLKLKSINLSGLVLTATSGDFDFLHEITVSIVPKPVNGHAQDPVVIGYAYSPDGFGESISLVPPDDVDLLEIIQANDDNPAAGCPKLEITITGTKPTQRVEWEGQVEADIYATLGG